MVSNQDNYNDDNDKSYFNIKDNYYKYDNNNTYYGKCVFKFIY